MNSLLYILGLTEVVLILFFLFVFLLLPLIALIDILKNEFTGNNKLIWVLVVIFFPFIGMILYFTMGQEHKIKNRTKGVN